MFRRTKHYALTAPLECLLSNGQTCSGTVVNLSLHGAFIAETSSACLAFRPGERIGMSLQHSRGNGGAHLEVKARIVWRNAGGVPTLPNGLGLEFVHDEQTLRQCVAMIAQLCRHDVVKQDRSRVKSK